MTNRFSLARCIRSRIAPALAALFLVSVPLSLAADPKPIAGSRVQWARLNTLDSSWDVHSGNDPALANFIRANSRLNIDPKCYSVTPERIDELRRYPFIFTNNLCNVPARYRGNIREYLQRGGFIYIDRCVNLSYSRPMEAFYREHMEFFASILPEATMRQLPRTHEIFTCHFRIRPRVEAGKGDGHDGIYAFYLRGRIVALLSNASYQCGWPQSGDNGQGQAEMIANIYVYAMMAEPLTEPTQSDTGPTAEPR